MAAATITPVTPGGVTNGKAVEIATTSTALHTATNTANEKDAITIYVFNTTVGALNFTLEWGGTSSPDIQVRSVPPGDGIFVAVARRAWGGIAITGKGSATGLRAEVSVDRYTPAS